MLGPVNKQEGVSDESVDSVHFRKDVNVAGLGTQLTQSIGQKGPTHSVTIEIGTKGTKAQAKFDAVCGLVPRT